MITATEDIEIASEDTTARTLPIVDSQLRERSPSVGCQTVSLHGHPAYLTLTSTKNEDKLVLDAGKTHRRIHLNRTPAPFLDTELGQRVVEHENPELAMIDLELKQPQPSDLATVPLAIRAGLA